MKTSILSNGLRLTKNGRFNGNIDTLLAAGVPEPKVEVPENVRSIDSLAELKAFEAEVKGDQQRLSVPVCGLPVWVALSMSVVDKLIEATKLKEANPRLNSSASNIKQINGAIKRGLDYTKNAKAGLLVYRMDGAYVVTDGFHSLAAYKSRHPDGSKPFVTRMTFVTREEHSYFAANGDHYHKTRTNFDLVVLNGSNGETLEGKVKDIHCRMATYLISVEHGICGGSLTVGPDQVMEAHKRYVDSIECVVKHKKLMDSGRSVVKSVCMLAFLALAHKTWPAKAERFIKEYSTLNNSSEVETVERLLGWLDRQTVSDKVTRERVFFGASWCFFCYCTKRPVGKTIRRSKNFLNNLEDVRKEAELCGM